MAKIRAIKPEFWLDDRLASISPYARLLYIGLWNFCDDNGVVELNHKKLKVQIFPYDNVNMEKLLKEIEDIKNLVVFSWCTREYIFIPTFKDHQKIDKRFFKEIIKGFTEDLTSQHAEYPPSTRRVPTYGVDVDIDVDIDVDKEINKEKEVIRKIFIIPKIEEIKSYCLERKNNINPVTFFNYYESKGWMIGKNKMKNWKACIHTWEEKHKEDKPSIKDNLHYLN